MTSELVQVKGVGPAVAKTLVDYGFDSVDALATASVAALSAIPGFGPARAAQVIAAASDLTSRGEDERSAASGRPKAGIEKKKKKQKGGKADKDKKGKKKDKKKRKKK